jgi:hypothetical protein
MTKSYTLVTEIIYTLWQVLCVTRWDKLSFTWFDETDLRREAQSVPRHCAKHITQVRTNIDAYRQQTKTKVPNKDIHENRTQQVSLVTLQITAILKHRSRFITYYALRPGQCLPRWQTLPQNYIYDGHASNKASVTMGQNNRWFSRLKKRSFFRSFIVVKNRPFYTPIKMWHYGKILYVRWVDVLTH